MQHQTGILGIRIDNISAFLDTQRYHWIATVNPEIIMAAYDDVLYSEVLNLSDLNIADGAGLEYIQLLLGKPTIKHRYPGIDLVHYIIKQAHKKKLTVALFGGMETFPNGTTVGEVAAQTLQAQYPNLHITTIPGGTVTTKNNQLILSEDEVTKINTTQADVLLVALAYPHQERFLLHLKDKCPQVRLAIGVGGSFKFLSGYTKRAPQWLQHIGLEWFWRLLFGGQSIRRIMRAVVRFPLTVLWRTLKPRYRQGNMACIINDNNEILLCQRANALPDIHWQMPQGGVDPGEAQETALLREIKEEVGTDKVEIIQQVPQKHTYTITDSYRFSYSGQQLTLWLVRYTGDGSDIAVDEREFVDWQWVPIDRLFDVLHPVRHASAKLCLNQLNTIR